MLKKVVFQGIVWESYEAILQTLCSNHMTVDMSGEEKSEEGLKCMPSDTKGQGG